ncbi:zinc-binding dehydrogenase [Aestuariicella hydrocarbonica]|uniref:Zinc-binding dehydrogenase n=1 Tax=Pseudomaricurvus hydrocarbonicus TaxID=1470433 RepID=A0A9E5JTJ2_9GAMM|nr:zinc-binding dehydrogenase [Aestuariicella hydrocarbonica]NHO64585.1 zinc-binding dehydrogenase [Aestuariicella hydrocarbonica]
MPSALQIQSTLLENGTLQVALADVGIPTPEANEVVVKIEAVPINPSDLGTLFGPADISQAESRGEGAATVLSAPFPAELMERFEGRVGQALTIGNEGAGVVVAAGSSDEAQALLGKTVALFGGSIFAQYRAVPVAMCLPLSEGTSAKEGASSFVNPLTSLAMVETMKMEGHKALVHTAAASNLGQMLNKICLADGIELVNIVRKQEQVDILKALGAKYICNSSSDTFMADLTDALHETGATIAFDATGGGQLADQILTAMEAAAARTPAPYSMYGTDVFKQVYLYGNLDLTPTILTRAYGRAWSLTGWLLTYFLAKIGPDKWNEMCGRVARELKTTFASQYTQEVSLVEMLDADIARQYNQKTTGEKYLLCPQKGL